MANANPMVAKTHTDWSKCCLCQMDKKDEILLSARTLYVAEHDGYKMLSTNMPLFDEINEMPMIVDLARLDDGGGIEDTLRKNQAQYHRILIGLKDFHILHLFQNVYFDSNGI